MPKFIIGVQVERAQLSEVLVEVDAEDEKRAFDQVSYFAYGSKGRELIRQAAKKISYFDWEVDSAVEIGGVTEVYNPKLYDAEVTVEAVKP